MSEAPNGPVTTDHEQEAAAPPPTGISPAI